MSPRTWIAAVAVVAATMTAAHAETKNEVRAVSFTEENGVTRVHVRGATTPTFTVYKLERPSRVVIDMPQARLADALRGHESGAVYSPNTWAVSGIAAQQLDDGAVRVIVTLARPGRYDVKTQGNDVVVMVMPRDTAPKTADPAALEKSRAEAEAAKAEADAAKGEAERLRKAAAEQTARAAAAQRAVDEARKAAQTNAANAADLAKAKQVAQAAKDQAEAASKMAQLAQIEADKRRLAAEQARRDAQAEAALAKADAEKARVAMAKAKAEAEKALADATKAQADASMAHAVASKAKADVSKAQADASKAKEDVSKAQAEMTRLAAEAAKAQAEAMKLKDAAASDVARAQAEAEAAKREAAIAKAEAARMKREAEATRGEAEKLATNAKKQLQAMEQKALAAQQLEDKARASLAAAEAREEAARESAQQAKQERALAEAAAKRAQQARDRAHAADRDKLAAEAKAAEDRLAKARLATEEADARRRAAEQMATSAKQDLEQSKSALATVEQQRVAAVAAASEAARKRSEAEAAAQDAARKRSEAETAALMAAKQRRDAEVAASAATKQRTEAETAANAAAKRRTQAELDRAAAEQQLAATEKQKRAAEQQRNAAEQQRLAAEQAARAAEKQRTIAESSARDALVAKRDAETSLAELTKKRQAAERAADEVAMRTKAEAKAQAEMTAAKSRKASQDEIAAARREVAKLTEERKRAESELADRRKAVAQQQSEAARLETAAAQARDAAAREEMRRAQLAHAREAEERDLAKLKAQKVQAQVAAAQQQVHAQVAQTPTRSASDPKLRSAPSTPAPVPAPVAAVKLAKVNNVTFKGNDGSGIVEIAVSGDASISLGETSATTVELIVDGAHLAPKLERTLDVSKFGSPVKKVSSFRDRRSPNRVRLVAELSSPAIPTVVRDGGIVRWRFASNDTTAQAAKRPVGGFGAASTPVAQQTVSQLPGAGNRRRTYYGQTVEFDFKDAPIHDLLRIIADTGGVNIVVPDSIDAKVTVRLKRVPWDQALEVILASHGLWYRREGNLYRIAPRKELDAEDEAEAARRAAAVQAEAPKPEVVTLNYASADELRPKLEGMLSPKGKIEVDGRTNSLIINDVAGNRESIARLALQLDTQTPQITIEARIVEAQSTYIRQFGIQWGGRALAGAAGGNATGLIFPSSIGIRGANTDAQTPEQGVSALPSDFAINLPATTGTGAGGAIGLSLGSVGGNFNINLRLSALEDTGTVRIVSAPKITVLNNKSALIRSGVSIPISVVSAAGTQTQFVQADLKLEVTPYVSQRDCSIAMQLDVSKNEPDFVNTGARGDPTILRREARTTMLVGDGETTVLGGIYTRNSGLAYNKVPFLGDLPVLGWLFKSRTENDNRTEILVFITPKITNKASLRCVQ